jgi:hypothetical protein
LASSWRNSSKIEATLKDLCTEDKQKIATLINQLAKVTQEKQQLELEIEDDQYNLNDVSNENTRIQFLKTSRNDFLTFEELQLQLEQALNLIKVLKENFDSHQQQLQEEKKQDENTMIKMEVKVNERFKFTLIRQKLLG